LAEGLAAIAGIEVDGATVQTNIVRFRVTAMAAGTFADRCFEAGLHMVPSGAEQMRAVLHLGVSDGDVGKALSIIETVIARRAA
jgi:threonine aldolase